MAVVGLIVFALALGGLAWLRHGSELRPPYPRQKAVTAALRDPEVKAFLAGNTWSSARVIALDRRAWRVTFWDGPRVVLDAAIGPQGRVEAIEQHPPNVRPPGSTTLWTPALIVLLAALFVLALATRPLRSLRNLDAVVIAVGFTASAFLLDARLVAAHVYVGIATLGYVALRCGRVGLGHADQPVGQAFFRTLVVRTDADRILAWIGGALLLAGLILTVTSTGASDVAAAGLAGATLLNHGVPPYGHLPEFVVHGDTYPLLTYVLFMPSAALGPVHDAFDSLDGALWLNALALALAAAGMARLSGRTHLLAWLAFPPILIAATGGGNDVPAAAFVVAALLAFGRPVLSTALLTLAGWVKIVPAAALAVWLPRLRGRQLATAIGAALLLLGAGVVVLLALGGDALSNAVTAIRFQLERGSWYSLWQQLGARGLQLVFQAATLGFAAAIAVHVQRAGAAVVGLRRAAALAGALVALLQIGANYWTYAYLAWLLPFILVALFPPAPRRSPPPAPPVP